MYKHVFLKRKQQNCKFACKQKQKYDKREYEYETIA